MKIAVVGELYKTISKNSLAGTEIWTYNLIRELVKRKHTVTLFATNESKTNAKLISVCKQREIDVKDEKEKKKRYTFFSVKEFARVVKLQNDFDLIHISKFDFYNILPMIELIDKPVIITDHGFISSKKFLSLIIKNYKNITFVFISDYFAKAMPRINKYVVIKNAILVKEFSFSQDQDNDNFFFWMNRINKVKGVEHAIEFSKQTNTNLKIAGPILENDYYNDQIKNNLSKKIKYVGALSFAEKNEYYRKAKAFLMTINWNEPFGLTVIESMACGTPVIAFNRGAMKEIIINGYNGYLVDPEDGVNGLVKAYKKLESLSKEEYRQMRLNCRKHVEENFSIEKMVENYEKVYQKVIDDWKKKK